MRMNAGRYCMNKKGEEEGGVSFEVKSSATTTPTTSKPSEGVVRSYSTGKTGKKKYS